MHEPRVVSGFLMRRDVFPTGESAVIVFLMLLAVCVSGIGLLASTVNGVTMTLLNSTYNRSHDITEFRYRVSSAPDPDVRSWVLQIPDCIEDSAILFTNKPCSWVREPFRGLQFDVPHVTTTYHVRLSGYWDTASVQAAVMGGASSGDGRWSLVSVPGPGCSTWMSLEVIDGESIVFPDITGAGRFPAESRTILRVTCSLNGWLLDHIVHVSVPSGGRSDAVHNALSIAYGSFRTMAGTTDITVAYALEFGEQDFAELPSGDYQIAVVYTLISPD
ncbi:hypothetical protein JW848_11060, partial [Candidatus Bipolaricaulota bacterium]|nr:hypothetical protein [Candidatus Bipolaricaulota bacterium]